MHAAGREQLLCFLNEPPMLSVTGYDVIQRIARHCMIQEQTLICAR